MKKYQEIEGDLIKLALEGRFGVIAHGVNCFCTMGAGIAPQMARMFRVNEYSLEDERYAGNINKLGQIEYETVGKFRNKTLFVVNAYTQYGFGKNHAGGFDKPVDYEAITLCMRKINHDFKGFHVGLPQIGCGLAGGDWTIVKGIIQRELIDCKVTVVIYKP